MMPLQSSTVGRFLDDVFNLPPAYGDPIGYAVQGIVAFVALYVLGRALVLPLADRAMNRRNLDRHAKKPLNKVLFFVILFVAVGAAFAASGRGNILASLATIAAAATLAIGFAMQDVLKNFVAGIFIFVEKPFKIGDWIEWDDSSGVVEDISLRVSRVRTFDNELLTVPNDKITGAVVRNYSARDKRRESLTFGVSYDADIEQAKYIIHGIVADVDGVLDDPDPTVKIDELAETPVNVKLRYWITTDGGRSVLDIRDELYRKVKNAFDEEGIDIPYPTYTIDGDSLQVDQQ